MLEKRVKVRQGKPPKAVLPAHLYGQSADMEPILEICLREAPWGRHTRWLTVITVDPTEFGADREAIRLALEAENIVSNAPSGNPCTCSRSLAAVKLSVAAWPQSSSRVASACPPA